MSVTVEGLKAYLVMRDGKKVPIKPATVTFDARRWVIIQFEPWLVEFDCVIVAGEVNEYDFPLRSPEKLKVGDGAPSFTMTVSIGLSIPEITLPPQGNRVVVT
jgi:hypothetical protein